MRILTQNKTTMTKLVIVESPAKCQKIQGFLGEGWRVIASMGHIRALQQDLAAVGLSNNFEPTYEWIKEKSKAIKQLKDAAKGAEVYLSADDDREGEAIAYAVCLLLKLNPMVAKRAVFHEITEKAVKQAVTSPRLLNMNIVHAQQARAMLDMMIGFTMSPLLWRYVAPALSAGRCQTPALRLVVEREAAIDSFKPTSSCKLSAVWKHPNISYESVMEDELEDEESAVNYMEQVYQQKEGTIIKKEIKPWSQAAPVPLITSTLQQQASALYHMNPKNTMKVAQKLYEAGYITYMRTDKAVLSEEAVQAAKQWVTVQYGEEYVAVEVVKESKKKKPKIAKEDASKDAPCGLQSVPPTQKNTSLAPCGLQSVAPPPQEAHEAIRPTHMEVTEIDGDAYEKKLYKLIWQRAIQSVMSAAKGETCVIKTQIKEDQDFTWLSQWTHTTFEGWKRAGKVASIEEEEQEEESTEMIWKKVIHLNCGDHVQWTTMKAEPKETKAQGRYTEATLVRELEKCGIGRPSTFASLLAAIQDKDYVTIKDIPAKEVTVKEYTIKPNQWPATEKTLQKKVGAEKNKLVPTELGRSVLHFMLNHFEDLFAYGFTAQMEQRLDHVADGTEPWKELLKDMWESYKDRYEDLKKQPAKTTASVKVKEFSNGLKAVMSKKGPIILREGKIKEDTQFFGWPQGLAFEQITEESANTFVEQSKKVVTEIGSWKDVPIIKKSGKFGEYLQCGDVSIPYQVEELEKTIERLEAKSSGSNAPLKQFKEYVIRTGQYGPYIMKTSLKKPQFVSLPKGITINTLTEKEVEALYKAGLESKKKWAKIK